MEVRNDGGSQPLSEPPALDTCAASIAEKNTTMRIEEGKREAGTLTEEAAKQRNHRVDQGNEEENAENMKDFNLEQVLLVVAQLRGSLSK